jgi:hypothetical protein
MANSNPSSPSHFGLAGNFSADDIQELLGAMTAEHQHPRTGTGTGTGTAASSSRAEEEDEEEGGSYVDRPGEDGVGGDNDNDIDNDNDNDIDDEIKAQARSERKRSREKQRRSDVNHQFADLTALLNDIEAEEAEEDHTVARLAFSPSNRVDMIARTILHLERLRAVNKRRKREVDSLQVQLDQAKKAGEDTAAKLKEAMFSQPVQSKQVSTLYTSSSSSSSFCGCVLGIWWLPLCFIHNSY